MSEVTSIFDLEALAKKRLPGVIFDYVHGGSYEQVTLERNLNDMKALALRQHDMRDVSDRNTAVTMVGDPCKIPLAIGPTGLAGLTWANGEVEAAKAAEDFGAPGTPLISARTPLSFPITAAVSWTARLPPSPSFPRSPRQCATRSRSSSTAASAPASTSSKPWAGAPIPA